MAVGQALFLDSLAPHFSDANDTGAPRRLLLATYTPSREGDLREEYYREKRRQIAGRVAAGQRPQISIISDFQGVVVD